jgi:hypothetical protein
MIVFKNCSKNFIFRTKSVFYTKSVLVRKPFWYEALFGTKTVELSIIFSLKLILFRNSDKQVPKLSISVFSEMDLRKFSSLPSIEVVDDESSAADSAVLDEIKVTNCKRSRLASATYL